MNIKYGIICIILFLISCFFGSADTKFVHKDDEGNKRISYYYLSQDSDEVEKFDELMIKGNTKTIDETNLQLEKDIDNLLNNNTFLEIIYSEREDEYMVQFYIADDIVIDDDNDILTNSDNFKMGKITLRYIFDKNNQYEIDKMVTVNTESFNMLWVEEDTISRFIQKIKKCNEFTVVIVDDSNLPLEYTFNIKNLPIDVD